MTAPDTSFMDLSRIAALAAVELGAAPCAVVAAAARRGGAVRRGFGAAGRLWPSDDAPIARIDTIFDLASVTKPITALALARLARRGVIARDEPLASVLPELASTRSAHVPIDCQSGTRSRAAVQLFADHLHCIRSATLCCTISRYCSCC